MVGQDAQQHLSLKSRNWRFPVEIEKARIAAGEPVLQNVPPPAVGRNHRRHVVGHDVDHHVQAFAAEVRHHTVEARLPAQLIVDPGGIDHVITMAAARGGLKDRRAVRVADPKSWLHRRRTDLYISIQGSVAGHQPAF